MKLLSYVTILLLCVYADVFSQSHFTHTVTTVAQQSGISPEARDFWFAIPQNSDPNDDAGKVFMVLVSMKTSGTAHIQVNGQAALTRTMSPGGVWEQVLPSSVELHSSGTVELDKAIHVWSDDAEITVYVLSRNPFTSDGFMAIPRSFWDTSYVVASYSALIVSPTFDLPSEFCVVAAHDSTRITITPTQNLRRTGDPGNVFHEKGKPFTVLLYRGQCIQYQTVFDLGGSELDLTGTVVTATKPIGLIGASVCPFIPADPYCDHICEMLLPVSRWGRTYHTVPFAGRKLPGGDSFYLIGSAPGQAIFRNGNQYAAVGRFERHFRDDINEPSVWTSSAPFMLVQYINSSTYGVPAGGSRNQGDPAMVQINPAEYGRKELTIQIPLIGPAPQQTPFTDYINILVPTVAVSSLLFNGTLATSLPNMRRFTIPGSTIEGIRLPNVVSGTHTIKCDSPVTAYAYGYATDDSYAWSVLGPDAPFVKIVDTIAPVIVTTDSCNCTTIAISDVHANASKIVSMEIVSKNYLDVTLDPLFTQGNATATTSYRLCHTTGESGNAKVKITDGLENVTSVTTSYLTNLTHIDLETNHYEFQVEKNATADIGFHIINHSNDTLEVVLPAELIGSGRFSFLPDSLPALAPNRMFRIILHFLGDDTTQEVTFRYSYDSCNVVDSITFKAIVKPSGSVERAEQIQFNVHTRAHDRTLVVEQNSSHASTIELYDMLGKLWLRHELGDVNEMILLPAGITGGSYIVRYTTPGYVTSRIIQVLE